MASDLQAASSVEFAGEADPRTIEEDAKVWKKNSEYLYDRLLTVNVEWPSLTFQWLPVGSPVGGSSGDAEKTTVENVLLGTNTSDKEENNIVIAQVELPWTPALDRLDKQSRQHGGGEFKVVRRIAHEQEVNRARIMPQDPSVIATHGPYGPVNVFLTSKNAEESSSGVDRLQLIGHSKEGYALSWSPHHTGLLASGAYDKTVCVWDIQGDGHTTTRQALTFEGHTDMVEDVAWQPLTAHRFGSVGDDRRFLIWDTRMEGHARPVMSVDAHKDAVNCLAFNPVVEFLAATGSSDKTVALWDTRNFTRPLHILESHTDSVYCLDWSTTVEGVLASGGDDRQVIVWDTKKIGDEQTGEAAEDGPPEVLFVHGGHTAVVRDLGWSPVTPWLCGSADENNAVHFWQPAKKIVVDDEPDIDPASLE